jgi:hypothetical protein
MRQHCVYIALFVASTASLATAETIVLQNGTKIEGTLVGASADQVDIVTASGETKRIPMDTVKSIGFPKSATAAPSPGKGTLLPTGTVFRVKTIDAIDVDSTEAGMKFNAALDDPIMKGGSVIVPRGADVVLVVSKVAQGGKMKGSDLIELKVASITVNGKSNQVVTSVTQDKSGGEGKKTTGKILGGAGLGAIIGGIAGGGTGAAIGALSGGAVGTVVAASGQPHLKIPSETRLEYQLMADWRVR